MYYNTVCHNITYNRTTGPPVVLQALGARGARVRGLPGQGALRPLGRVLRDPRALRHDDREGQGRDDYIIA